MVLYSVLVRDRFEDVIVIRRRVRYHVCQVILKRPRNMFRFLFVAEGRRYFTERALQQYTYCVPTLRNADLG